MNILFITQLLPFPLDTGGKIKTYKTLKLLSKKHKIHLVCFVANQSYLKFKKELEKICTQVKVFVWPMTCARFKKILWHVVINFFSLKPFIVYRYYHPKMEAYLENILHKYDFGAIHIDHINMSQYLPQIFSGKKILDEHNIEYLAKYNVALYEANFLYKILFFWETIRLYFFEKKYYQKFDQVLAISKLDRKRLSKLKINKEKITVCSPYFKSAPLYRFKVKNPMILFIGLLSWWPNKNALFWFIKEIYPFIKTTIPNTRLEIVGAGVQKKLKALCLKNRNIELVGYVKDIEPYLKKASVFIAPFKMGGGIRIKVLTAMAAGIPVVGTKKGFEGIIESNSKKLLIANNGKQIANHIIQAITSKRLAVSVSRRQLNLINKFYSQAKQTKVLKKIYE